MRKAGLSMEEHHARSRLSQTGATWDIASLGRRVSADGRRARPNERASHVFAPGEKHLQNQNTRIRKWKRREVFCLAPLPSSRTD